MHKFRIKNQKENVIQLRGWQLSLAEVKLLVFKKFLCQLKVHVPQFKEHGLNKKLSNLKLKILTSRV
jgi:hypothetical protein